MKIVNCKRTGLLPEHRGIAPLVRTVRATVPVIEALRAAGAEVVQTGAVDMPVYRISLGATMPPGIVAEHVNGPPYVSAALRMEDEPAWPMAYPDGWAQVDWTPCPVPGCGAPLVWYEAAYAPGYRVCSRPPHHHSQAR